MPLQAYADAPIRLNHKQERPPQEIRPLSYVWKIMSLLPLEVEVAFAGLDALDTLQQLVAILFRHLSFHGV